MGLLAAFETGLRRLAALGARNPGALWLRWGREAHHVRQGLDYVRRSAGLGHPGGLLELGLFYVAGGFGGGGAKQGAEAYFQRALEAGEAEAGFHLGEALRWRGQADEALAAYSRAAAGGYRPAARWLAEAYETGDGVAVDPEAARRWRERERALPPREPRRSALIALPGEPWRDPLVRLIWLFGEVSEAVGGAMAERPWFQPVFSAIVLSIVAFLAVGLPLIVLRGSMAFYGVTLIPLVPAGLILLAMHSRMRRDHGYAKSHVLREARADAGDPEANHLLGLDCLGGSPYRPRDPAEARRRFRVAAEAGYAPAQFQLSELERWGAGGPKDLARSNELLRASAAAGHRPAVARLVEALEAGDGMAPDPEALAEARAQLTALPPEPPPPPPAARERLGAGLGSLTARADREGARVAVQPWFPWVLGTLALLLAAGVFAGIVLFVWKTTFGWMVALGMAPLATWSLYYLFRQDRGPSFEGGRRLRRAEGGDPEACYHHAMVCLQGGRDAPKDASAARLWFQRAAEAGHVEAMVRLAELLRWGMGGLRRKEEARAWLLRAAEAGHPEAARILEDMDAEEEPSGE